MRFHLNYTQLILLLLICVGCGSALKCMAQGPHDAQLYGMTQYGGVDHKGNIFHFTPSIRQMKEDYQFKYKFRGSNPKGDLVVGNNGKYYGTASAGGAFNAGVIYEWDSISNVVTELYDFTRTDGADPRGAMLHYNSKLYGLTYKGGAHNYGVIYEWDIAAQVYTKLYDMDSINGMHPDGSLTLADSVLYGFAHDGGAFNKGVLFEWNLLSNAYTKHFDFDSIKGSHPVGKLVAFGNHKLYAMTNKGGTFDLGTIYEFDYASHIVNTKYNFNGTNGQYPLGYLTLYTNNKFYGVTYEGGQYETALEYDHFGVLFEWNPVNNAFVKKKNLGQTISGVQGAHGILGSLSLKDGILYGCSSQGLFGSGGIFKYNPGNNSLKDLHLNHVDCYACNYYTDERSWQAPGTDVYGAMLLSGNRFLVASSENGAERRGVVFEYYPDSNIVGVSNHFAASDGMYPKGSLIKKGNKLYGMSELGGISHMGNIFEIDLANNNQFTELLPFDGFKTSGQPWGTLTYYNGLFYGVNQIGRKKSNLLNYYYSRYGVSIFSWDPASNQFQMRNESDVNYPLKGSLAMYNGKFITPGIGGTGWSIMEFNPATDSSQMLSQFNSTNGDFQMYQDYFTANGLTEFNGKLYGTTPNKNPNGGFGSFKGGIYEFDPATNTINNKINLADSMGIIPTGDLTLVDSVFYGVCSGTPISRGVLFKWDPSTNVYTKLVDFDYVVPFNQYIQSPSGTLTYSKGKLYGLGYGIDTKLCWRNTGTPAGSVYLPGNLFEYDILLDSITWVEPFNYDGSDPNNSGLNPAFTKLLEVIPNKAPVLSNIPGNQSICNNQVGQVSFTISDADMDTMHFVLSSSNSVLMPLANMNISYIDSLYTLSYSNTPNQLGNTNLTVIADDGYGDTVQFSFSIQAEALPNDGVTINGNTLTADQIGANYQWIDCSDNSLIAGETNQSFNVGIDGNYAVIVTQNNCSDTSECLSIITVGLNKTVSKTSFCVLPNPAHDEIKITLPNQENVSANLIMITNALGELMIKQKNINKNININGLGSGVYFISVETNQGNYYAKFMKE
jgi:uncharacterized repeat protein (TIGR03803 family)